MSTSARALSVVGISVVMFFIASFASAGLRHCEAQPYPFVFAALLVAATLWLAVSNRLRPATVVTLLIVGVLGSFAVGSIAFD